MAIRLEGDVYSMVQGLDEQGWLREIEVVSTDPGLLIKNTGSGYALDVKGVSNQNSVRIGTATGNYPLTFRVNDGGVAYITSASHLELNSGAALDIILNPAKAIDATKAIYNSGTSNSGKVLIDDDLAIVAGKRLDLEGHAGDSYLIFQNNRIEVFVNGVLEGYIDATGFVSTV